MNTAPMARYLLNISYIGTGFRGAQRQISVKDGYIPDPSTIQGCIEMALKHLNPLNEPFLTLSSRTDSGVHAMHTTMQVDLVKQSGHKYHPQDITLFLNKYFSKKNTSIRILNTYIVPKTFHCRANAISRTYLYRLAVIKGKNCKNLLEHIPIEELDRCLYICTDKFDVDKAREAANLFVGYHDFKSFMGKSTKNPDKITRKTVEVLSIEKVPLYYYTKYSWPFCVNNEISDYNFYNIYFKANGFLYKQVRRTVASLIAVAQGKVTPRDIKFMIQVPSHRSWIPSIKTVPAHGLYLCEVAYTKNDLDTFQDHLEA